MLHANFLFRIVAPVFSVIIVGQILLARRRHLFIRRIAGLSAIEDAIGRATEMGRPMIGCTGLGINGGIEIVSLQALSILSYVVRAAVRFGTRMVVPVVFSVMMPVTQEAIREAYTVEGRPEMYDPGDIRFLSERQFAFAASTAGLIFREQAAACFWFGAFYAESLIFAEAGQQVGAIQVAGTPSTLQIPFFIAACDYVIIGDEFYAASAYLSREPTALGSIVGQDYVKALLLAIVVACALVVSFHPTAALWLTQHFLN